MQRLQALHAWLCKTHPVPLDSLKPASADASFRRYFRFSHEGRPWIVMDAPPEKEDCRPFLAVARLFGETGVHVPEVLAYDLDQGFILMSDMGNVTYLEALKTAGQDAGTVSTLYGEALTALVQLQKSSRPGVLPPYDDALLRRETALFPEWYLGRHLQLQPSPEEQEGFRSCVDLLIANHVKEPQVYVHRDYHSRNLMCSDPNPGVLDFQDAVMGPVTYDCVSLLKDAYVTLDEEVTIDLLARYWEQARRAGIPLNADFGAFYRDFEWMGVQRHLKVMGIFARLFHRDGKPGYLNDMPRVMAYLQATCRRYRELQPLALLLDRWTGQEQKTGYTF